MKINCIWNQKQHITHALVENIFNVQLKMLKVQYTTWMFVKKYTNLNQISLLWKKEVYIGSFIKMEFSAFSSCWYNINIHSLHVQCLHGGVFCNLWTKDKREHETKLVIFVYQTLQTLLLPYLDSLLYATQTAFGTRISQMKSNHVLTMQ